MFTQNLKFNSFFLIASILSSIIVVIRCFNIPFTQDEAVSFFTYIQSNEFIPYHSFPDVNNHVLNSFFTWISYQFFGSSPFALRLPNLISFFVLLYAIYKISQLFKSFSSKFLLVVLLLSFSWIGFFSVCRGYGISMSFLLLSIFYFLNYFKSSFEIRNFVGFICCVQLSIASNLTIQIVAVLLTGILIFFQIINKKIIDLKIISIYLIHILILKFWADYSFYLKENGALNYGQGENYWGTTFKSLIELILGFENKWIEVGIGLSIIGLTLFFLYKEIFSAKKIKSFFFNPSIHLIIPISFCALILVVFFLKIFGNVNFPKDRTALFFYPFFVLNLVYILDFLKLKKLNLIISIIFCLHFVLSLNVSKHSFKDYKTLPDSFFAILKNENKSELITIGAQKIVIQYALAYQNYESNEQLNLIDYHEKFEPLYDYYIEIQKEEEKLKHDYLKIANDKNWGFGLYKRKNKVQKDLIFESNLAISITQEQEFYNLLKWKDTILAQAENKALLFEFEFNVKSASKPFAGTFILNIESENHKNECYKGFSMNQQKFDWNNQFNNKYSILSPKLESDSTNYSFYFWNKKMQEIDMEIKSFRVYILS